MYRMSILKRLVRFSGKEREAPFVLYYVHHTSKDGVTGANGPSWVPQWAKIQDPAKRPSIGYYVYSVYSAGGWKEKFHCQASNNPNEKLLTVQGFLFDTVAWVSRPIYSWNLNINPNNWDDEARSCGIAFTEVLWKQVLNGLESMSNPPEIRQEDVGLTLTQNYTPDPTKVALHSTFYKAYLRVIQKGLEGDDYENAREEDWLNARNFQTHTAMCHARRLAITAKGRLALVHLQTEPGDVCGIFLGATVPYILRPAQKNRHHLVGESYVHGVMNGELIEGLECGEYQKQDISMI